MNLRTVPPFALPALMLGVPLLGSLASVLRGVLLHIDHQVFFFFALLFLLPVAVMAALCIWVGQRNKGAAWGAGLAVTLLSTGLNFYLLMPEHLQRDGTGVVSLYVLLGWLFPLMPTALLGGMVGVLVWRSPAPSTRPTLALKPWLWPLALPFIPLTFAVFGSEGMGIQNQPFSLAPALFSFFSVCSLMLGLVVLPLVLLRQQANKTHQAQSSLSAWWGVCVGLASAVLVFHFWIATAFGLLFVLGLVLPFIGYGVGLLWGERQSRLAAPPAPIHPNG